MVLGSRNTLKKGPKPGFSQEGSTADSEGNSEVSIPSDEVITPASSSATGLRRAVKGPDLPYGLPASYFASCSAGDRDLLVKVLPEIIGLIESKGVKVHVDPSQFNREKWPGFVLATAYAEDRGRLYHTSLAISTRKTFEPAARNTGCFFISLGWQFSCKATEKERVLSECGSRGYGSTLTPLNERTPESSSRLSNGNPLEYRSLENLFEGIAKTHDSSGRTLSNPVVSVLDQVEKARIERLKARHTRLVDKAILNPRAAALLGWQRREIEFSVVVAPEDMPWPVNRRLGLGMSFPAKTVVVAHGPSTAPSLDQVYDPATKSFLRVAEGTGVPNETNKTPGWSFGRLPVGSVDWFMNKAKGRVALTAKDPLDRAEQAGHVLRDILHREIQSGNYANSQNLRMPVTIKSRVPVLEMLLRSEHPGSGISAAGALRSRTNAYPFEAKVGDEKVLIDFLDLPPVLRSSDDGWMVTVPSNGKVGFYAVVYHRGIGDSLEKIPLDEKPCVVALGGPTEEPGRAEDAFVDAISQVLGRRALEAKAVQDQAAGEAAEERRKALVVAAMAAAHAHMKSRVEIYFHGEETLGATVTVEPGGDLVSLHANVTIEKDGRKVTFVMLGERVDGEIGDLSYAPGMTIEGVDQPVIEAGIRAVMKLGGRS